MLKSSKITSMISFLVTKINLKMMMMMMMNCFCGMVDRRKAFSLISSRNHCQISSPPRISDTRRAGIEPAQNLSSGLVESSCAVVITTTPRCHKNSKIHPNSSTIWKIKWKFAPPFKIGVVQSIRARWALLSPPKLLNF